MAQTQPGGMRGPYDDPRVMEEYLTRRMAAEASLEYRTPAAAAAVGPTPSYAYASPSAAGQAAAADAAAMRARMARDLKVCVGDG